MKNKSLFAIGPLFNPFYLLDVFINPFTHSEHINLSSNPLNITWTNRANKQLQKNVSNITVEMQLYFSCVVKKRVIFYKNEQDFESTSVNEKLQIAFHTVEASSCDPVEFAKHFPAKRILDSEGALKMKPRELKIDFRHNEWTGEFTI